MTKKTKEILLLILGIVLIFIDFKSVKNISDFFQRKYRDENLIKEKYEEENYNFVVEVETDLNFLKANSLVKLGETNEEMREENYREALELYKLAIEQKEDINILKNYEIVLNRLEKIEEEKQEENENQENQEEQQESNESNQSSDEDSEENRNSEDSNQDEDGENEDKEQNENQQESENQQENQEENPQSIENSSVNSEEKSELEKEEERKMEELQYILQKLEGNEKQAFKNNERFINQGSEENSNKW